MLALLSLFFGVLAAAAPLVLFTEPQTAARSLQTVAGTSVIVDRDATFVEQAVRDGQFDATTRALSLRRLEDAGRRIDEAVRNLRAARAEWMRRVSGLP